jgi:hypothetical protein
MAAESRRQLWLLAILAVTLVGVLWWRLSPEPVQAPVVPPRVQAGAGRHGNPGTPGATVEAVHLDSLAAARTEPDVGVRDPFRFNAPAPAPPKPIAIPAPGSGGPGSPGSPGPMASTPTSLPGPPQMLLKFIGILKPTSAAPIAVLTDGKNVFYGREGETIEGRYRIERIGVESVEMAWADGQGHQVIRLSGS